MPLRGSKGAAGYDFHSAIYITIKPGTRELIPTGIILEIPEGYYLQLKSRSGLSVSGTDLQAGTIDEDYRGELKILLHNTSTSLDLVITAGDRVAQGIFRKYEEVEFEEVFEYKALSVTERGGKGFGSTGVAATPEKIDATPEKIAEAVMKREMMFQKTREKSTDTTDESPTWAPGDAECLSGL